MSKPSKMLYSAKLAAINHYVDLSFKNKNNFTAAQQREITRNYNLLIKRGLIGLNEDTGQYEPAVKFVKTKSTAQKRKYRESGINKLNGYFLRGAAPGDKVRGNKIIGEFYDKELIPLNFQEAEGMEEDELEEYIAQELATALAPYYEELKPQDYFTIVTANGWEMGRGRTKNKSAKKGLAKGKGAGKKKKLEELLDAILMILQKAMLKYQIGAEIIRGLYLYKFKNQRKPDKKELKALKRKRK